MTRRSCLLFSLAPLALLAQEAEADGRIYDEVRRRLANDPEVKGGLLQVDVKAGMVSLKGRVEKAKHREKAERLAKKVKGVQGVENQITVGPVS